ncbi:sensor domain-containing diguanylate cyclase [Rhodobacteraceae bacterium W635]|uniref:sensor domain-containing diguanylate cyclase n=1 Tax=Nioella halotolerans TaxID=2303578 RepID=UPI000E3E075F|nr:sensor domain-containing diguanylate cyclase [Rhodobacteraceae bacterium W635]
MNLHLNKLDDEAGRIAALKRIDALTYTSEASFKHVTGLLKLILEMEMVSINFITEDKQIMKARQGLDLAESPRELAFCNITIRKYEPLIIEDTHQDTRVRDNPFVTGAPFLRSYIGAPLTTVDGYNLGTICAFDPRPRTFTEREVAMIRKCAELVMNQLDLRNQANLDFLTEVANRRSFLAGLENEMARQRRSKANATVAFLDIDFFKRVNDIFGHPTGDRVLREFADIVVAQSRQNDLVARLGGEEFAVLLPDTDLDAARIWAERMREKVAETRFDGENALKLTVSVGLAAVDGTQTTPDGVMHMGDVALYEAKRQGRDRVTML